LRSAPTEWTKTAKAIQDRLSRWTSLNDLAGHAAKLPEAGDVLCTFFVVHQGLAHQCDGHVELADPPHLAFLEGRNGFTC